MARLRRHRVSLAAYLKDKDESVRQAAADLLNKASDEIVARARENLRNNGIRNRTGRLYSSLNIKRATARSPRTVIMSEVFAPLPKRERKLRTLWNSWNRRTKMSMRVRKPMRFKYPAEGVPYGRLIEFSPRINKPWFYKAWYDKRFAVEEMIINGVVEAWVKS